ncbi:ABC transporter substrate-binding protein, partial [Xanthomonas citri pv. citri]
PVLATEVPTAANGGVVANGSKMEVTWKLRDGVKWHDGAPFTAEDVKFTIDVALHPNTRITSRDGFDKIEKIEILDPHTIKLYFKQVYAPHDLIFYNTGAILPKHLLGKMIEDPKGDSINKADFNRAPVGTGPYK